MRRFSLHRKEDESGVSGTGRVAEGVVFGSRNRVALAWLSQHSSVVVYDSLADVRAIHGHGGKTELVWDEPCCQVCKHPLDDHEGDNCGACMTFLYDEEAKACTCATMNHPECLPPETVEELRMALTEQRRQFETENKALAAQADAQRERAKEEAERRRREDSRGWIDLLAEANERAAHDHAELARVLSNRASLRAALTGLRDRLTWKEGGDIVRAREELAGIIQEYLPRLAPIAPGESLDEPSRESSGETIAQPDPDPERLPYLMATVYGLARCRRCGLAIAKHHVRHILDPFGSGVAHVDGDPACRLCNHIGIGLPMCITCDVRTQSEGGPRPDVPGACEGSEVPE